MLEEQIILQLMNEMCIESLDPDTFTKWEDVKKSLEKTRSALK